MTSDRLALGLIAAGYAGLGAAIALYWQADPSAADRYLVLAGAVWALLSRWREAVGSPFPSPRIGLPLVALGALLYPVGWAGYFVLFKARSVPFWLMWVALSAALAGWLVAVYGRRAGLRLLFPLLFVGFALPLPDSVLHPFRERLQAVTTDVSEWLLRACGYSVSRPSGGFVLALAGGDLGIEEACSGVKALTALTAVAAFLAFRQRFGLLRGGLLVAAAVPVVVAVNVARVTLSGVIQEAAGPEYIRGGWHDALGFATVLGGLGVVLLVTKVLRPRSEMTDPSVAPLAVPTPASRNPVTLRTAGVLLTLSLVATAVVVWHSRTRIPPPVPAPDLADLPTDIGGWSEYRRLDVPYHIADMLQPNVILHREYRNNVGRSVTVWVIYWEAVHAMRGYHHPDVCLPKVGYREIRRGVEWLHPIGGGELPLTSRTFTGPVGDLYVLYWTQTGRRVWGPDDENEARASFHYGPTFRRALEVWTASEPPAPAGRLVVLVGSPHPTDLGREEVKRFARALADEVYRRCPTAAGPIPP